MAITATTADTESKFSGTSSVVTVTTEPLYKKHFDEGLHPRQFLRQVKIVYNHRAQGFTLSLPCRNSSAYMVLFMRCV